ncbi:DNA/RNA non-specific endonuclease [Leuconostocaceae bacterium ESL0958]|nr:DNA/RNA non-specific endonuclease [Leuconostocaceae bacterium ESL0958]
MAKKRKRPQNRPSFVTGAVFALIIVLAGFMLAPQQQSSHSKNPLQAFSKQASPKQNGQSTNQSTQSDLDLLALNWDGSLDGDIVHVNGNQANFTDAELQQSFPAVAGNPLRPQNGFAMSPLDSLGRSGQANFVASKAAMDRVQKRPASIPSSVRPSGWNIGDHFDGQKWVGGYHTNPKTTLGGRKQPLWNKSHIVGYQFFGMDTMKTENMTTGTRVENAFPGQLAAEDDIRNAIKTHPNITIRGQVTPLYRGSERLPRGVHYQAKSVADNGQTLNFNYWIFNVQPGVNINYQTGEAQVQQS